MATKLPTDDEPKKRVGRNKLRKTPRTLNRLPSAHVPERFKYGEDAQDDVTAPKGGKSEPNQYMYHSVFSMIAAGASKTDFNAKHEESSGSDNDEEGVKGSTSRRKSQDRLSRPEQVKAGSDKAKDLEKRKSTESKLLRSLPKLTLKSSSKSSKSPSRRTASPEAYSPGDDDKHMTPQDAPVMSRMLEAEAEFVAESAILETPKDIQFSSRPPRLEKKPSTTLLATRLMEIFGFDEPEKVVSEYPCWLLQSVLLQGYMYITQRHICFYAYLPKRSQVVSKSGHLSKRGRNARSKYNRYWFVLKGDVLSYYQNASDLYFPQGTVDLCSGISAWVSKDKGESKDPKDFTITTDHRTYNFRADSAASAKEWVKTLQKVIFRSHNDGDSVKISLPIDNVIDVEETESGPGVGVSETVRVRVVADDESYAIDEYFFSFFSFGREALNILRVMVDGTPAQQLPVDMLSPTSKKSDVGSPRDTSRPRDGRSIDAMPSPRGALTPVFHESVKATLLPHDGSSIHSGDIGRSSRDLSRSRKSLDMNLREYGRSSFDRGRRSGSTSRLSLNRIRQDKSPLPKTQTSTDSNTLSLEQGTTESSLAVIPSTDETLESASQILNRSDVFHSPTINRLQQEPGPKDESRDGSPDTAGRSAEVRVELPTRAHTQLAGLKDQNVSMRDSSPNSDAAYGRLVQSNSSPTLQELVKAGIYPLQRAAGFAGYLKNRSKRMSNLLATESMGYYEKVSGMWQGGGRHYGDTEGVLPDDDPDGVEGDDGTVSHGDRFRAHFALPETERLQATYYAYFSRVLPLYGKIYISTRKFCFRTLMPGMKTKLILPLKDIENVSKEKGFRFGYHGLVVVIRGHEEIFFEYNQAATRDDCAVTLHQILASTRYMIESGILARADQEEADAAKAEHEMLQEARAAGNAEVEVPCPPTTGDAHPILFDDPRASILNFKPTESLRITCLTIGSRGDVQPYIALCKGLLAEGHKPRIATHTEFEPWVRKHGIDFAPVDGDPAELMKICVENGMFTFSFLKEASAKFRGWIDELLTSAWKACQDSDLLIESPSAMAGIHIAEALGIPYFRAFGMPWTRTRAYPHAFAVPDHKMGGAYNMMTYVLFDNVFWKAISGQVNRWRKKELYLRGTNLEKLHPNKVPFLYNFSPSVVVPPMDFSDWIRVTGYWFLDEASGWTPPADLTDFIGRARADGKKIVYIGFGSIVVSDPVAMTQTVVNSVLKADVRCILAKGWSDRLDNKDASKPEVPLPPEILQIKSAPHDWLFKHIDAAAHHGGAGTTGASLRAGLPTIIKPFFGDQFFFGSRVEDLGVGICIKKLNVSVFSRALWEATRSDRMIVRAKVLGEQIRTENGVETAIKTIYRDLEYAKTLIKHRAAATANSSNAAAPDPSITFDDDGNIEESWTFIGDDSDPELVRRIAEWNPERMVKRDSSVREKDAGKAVKREGSAKASKRLGSLRGREKDRAS